MIDLSTHLEYSISDNSYKVHWEGKIRPEALAYIKENLEAILELTGMTFEEFHDALMAEIQATVDLAAESVKQMFEERARGCAICGLRITKDEVSAQWFHEMSSNFDGDHQALPKEI